MKTAEELGITPQELTSLIKTRNALESGCLVHYPYISSYNLEEVMKVEDGKVGYFNMYTTGAGCGTVACIGGWMAADMDRNQVLYVAGSAGGLYELFYPPGNDYQGITGEQAVKAIDNFLSSGHPHWNEVLGS